MQENYDVRFGNRVVGNVCVQKQGLYYSFCCRCVLSGDVICRLQVQSAKTKIDLGILVPIGHGFGLDTKIPVKRLDKESVEFIIVPKHIKSPGMLVPVYPEEPFAYIGKLKDAFLVKKGDGMHICIKEPGR